MSPQNQIWILLLKSLVIIQIPQKEEISKTIGNTTKIVQRIIKESNCFIYNKITVYLVNKKYISNRNKN